MPTESFNSRCYSAPRQVGSGSSEHRGCLFDSILSGKEPTRDYVTKARVPLMYCMNTAGSRNACTLGHEPRTVTVFN